ncbi:ABC transporter permease [Brevibacillus sp. NRS-1366]|uniref:ABC transporter permease n=1 Tax=Brevibacillus sp. NRS-1366 TaxID=3233899 RepID=UPI003D205BD2
MLKEEIINERRLPLRAPSVSTLVAVPGIKWLLLAIPLLYICFLFIYSMLEIFRLSLFNDNGFTLEYFIRFFEQPVYWDVMLITMKIALMVTLISLVLGYPLAYLLTKIESDKWRKWMFAAVTIPLWISTLVRTYAWTFLLQTSGVINNILISIGLIDEPIRLIYNTTGVMIGMTHVLLPYMVLSLYSVIKGIDRNLVLAAEGLGAHPIRAFWNVYFPLSLTGILSGSLLVFVLSIGYFVTPSLLGGTNDVMISSLIKTQVSDLLNWNFGSAIAIVLLVVTLLLTGLSYLLLAKYSNVKEVK